jgi:hypothetical protein
MKIFLYIILYSTIILCLNACVKDKWSGIIEGKIIDSESKPIDGVNVLLIQTGASFTTKADGNYQFKELDERLYDIYIKKDGYKDDTKQIKVLNRKTIRIDIILKKDE